jgi:GNAT superfamily N-acetyltransferase
MHVISACEDDIPAWLALAREVEELFGATLSRDEQFTSALRRNVQRGTAFCVRAGDGPPGAALLGGLLFSAKHRPVYVLGWLAVTERSRRSGIGQALVAHVMTLIEPPAELIVTSFIEDTPGGEAARQFYLKLGFTPAELLPGEGPQREPRQRFRKKIE